VILARSPGYVFNLGEGDTDVRCVERLLQQGKQATGASEAVQRLGEALALWRGVPLADVTGLAWLEDQAERLDELRLQVRRMLVEARLSAGEHAQLVPGLEQMLAETPLDEQLHAMLMVALYRAGRQADALTAYHRLRHILGEELGIDPGQRLRELQAAILRQDPSLDAPAPTPAALTPAAAVPVMRQAPTPAQLPSAVAGLAGRSEQCRPGGHPPHRRRHRRGSFPCLPRGWLCPVGPRGRRLPPVPSRPAAVRDDRRPHQPGGHSQRPRVAGRAGTAPSRSAAPLSASPGSIPCGGSPGRGSAGPQQHRLQPRPARRLPASPCPLRAVTEAGPADRSAKLGGHGLVQPGLHPPPPRRLQASHCLLPALRRHLQGTRGPLQRGRCAWPPW
jgi:hypothetical protein